MGEGRRYSDRVLLRRLFAEARPYWPHLALTLFLGLLATPLALLLPVPLQVTVDSVVGGRPPPAALRAVLPDALLASPEALLATMAGLMVAVALLTRLQGLLGWMLETWVGENLVLAFRAQLFHHVQRLSLLFHDTRGTADSVYRIQYDAPAIQYVAVQGLIPFLTSLVTLLAMIGVTASIDLRLALVALLVGPVLAVLSQVYRRRLRREWSLAKEQQSSAMSVLQESLSAVRVVKAFGQEERERDRYLERARAGLLAQLKVVFAEGWLGLLIGLTMAAGTAAVLYLGVQSVRSGDLTLGSLLLVMSYLAQLYPPLQEVGGKLTDIQKSLASAERAFALLDEPAEVASAPGALPVGRARGAVALENVTFGYVPGRPALREVSLEVPAGARVGIAGRTGAGKSTLLALLPRFYDPWAGRVLLDGRDLRDLDLADLRRQFSIVLQEPVLFSATVAENIAYGRPAATEAEIEAAARAAGAHDFVAALPEGYRTEVGERGARLSGGERQRIALARAFLKDAPILLLDEPTSSVDVKTEAGIMDAIERLMRGRTTFLIAHRLATLEGCDLRLEVADERVHLRSGDLSGVALPGPGSGPEPGDPA